MSRIPPKPGASSGALLSIAPFASAADAIVFPNLDGDADVAYEGWARILNASGSNGTYGVLLNGSGTITTTILYQRMYNFGSPSFDAGTGYFMPIDNGGNADAWFKFLARTGSMRKVLLEVLVSNASGPQYMFYGTATILDSSSLISSFGFAGGANGVGIGSCGAIWRCPK